MSAMTAHSRPWFTDSWLRGCPKFFLTLLLAHCISASVTSTPVQALLPAGFATKGLTSHWFHGPVNYKALVIAIDFAVYFFHMYLRYRQYQCYKRQTRPTAIVDLVSEEQFVRSNAYGLDNWWLSCVTSTVNQAMDFVIMYYDLLPWVWNTMGAVLTQHGGLGPEYELTYSMVYFTLFGLHEWLLMLPFGLYDTFVVEARYGFNKQSLGLYLRDLVLDTLLTSTLAAGVIAALVGVIRWAGPAFFVYAGATLTALSWIMFFLSILIEPLFNTFTPLQDGELKEQVEALANRLKFPLAKLYVVDASKHTEHSNAYVDGVFRNKRIVLYDTLVKQLDNEEICAVVGHELGHWKLNHVVKNVLISPIETFIQLYLLSFIVYNPAVYHSFGFHDTLPLVAGITIFYQLYQPVGNALGFATNILSRRDEFEADAFAVRLGYARPLRTALIKMGQKGLSNMVPDPWFSAYHHTHPSLVERLAAIEAAQVAHATATSSEGQPLLSAGSTPCH
ncbi:zinc metalloprotease [Dimargaris verticillata]|uniref:Ste24 endopeptidase n=1 Tax=Dimargaris verticillata TaxID=2761393 RepID=A0A9W8B5D9_9FUNG|nr:zinc metalloprotease [Dimargaris verticillata]